MNRIAYPIYRRQHEREVLERVAERLLRLELVIDLIRHQERDRLLLVHSEALYLEVQPGVVSYDPQVVELDLYLNRTAFLCLRLDPLPTCARFSRPAQGRYMRRSRSRS